MTGRKIRVLIVDDSIVGQNLLKGLLADDPKFEVIGVAFTGQQAIEFIKRDHPDVVSMDIYMPVMDGVDATRIIMEQTPVPIVIVSSMYSPSEVQMSFRILEAGALTILPRPFGPGHPRFVETARSYRHTLKMLSEIKVKALKVGSKSRVANTQIRQKEVAIPNQSKVKNYSKSDGYDIIAIGASAGGPQAIQTILKGLDKNIKCPVLIVQHIDGNFAEGYCEWLNSSSNIPIHIAKHSERVIPGHGYLPPGDHHLGLFLKGVLSVSQDPPERGLRPSVNYLFKSIHAVYGQRAIAIILSGMGEDGARAMKDLYDAGALTIAQEAGSTIVNGMPNEAIKLGGAVLIMTPEEIAVELNKLCS